MSQRKHTQNTSGLVHMRLIRPAVSVESECYAHQTTTFNLTFTSERPLLVRGAYVELDRDGATELYQRLHTLLFHNT